MNTRREEAFLLDRARRGDQKAIESLIEQYAHRSFAFALNLLGGDRDCAYKIATSSMVEAIRAIPTLGRRMPFIVPVIRAVIERARSAKWVASSYESEWMNRPPGEREDLLFTKEALRALSFDSKVLLLLRDQLNLRYADVAVILQVPEKTVKAQTIRARSQFRETLETTLSRLR